MCSTSYAWHVAVALVFLVAANLPGTLGYLRMRRLLRQFIDDDELDRRGLIDEETGGLYLSFFFDRKYEAFGNPDLTALGDTVRRQLTWGLAATLAVVLYAVIAYAVHGRAFELSCQF